MNSLLEVLCIGLTVCVSTTCYAGETASEARYISASLTASPACASTDRAWLAKLELPGDRTRMDRKENVSEFVICEHTSWNPFQGTLRQPTLDWLILFEFSKAAHKMVITHKFRIYRATNKQETVCPLFYGDISDVDQNEFPLTRFDFDHSYDVDLKDAPKYMRYSFERNPCYEIVGEIAHMSKGVSVNRIIDSYKRR